MSAFVERALPRRSPDTQVSTPDEQVPYWLSDERLDRREEARKRAKSRTGDRRET